MLHRVLIVSRHRLFGEGLACLFVQVPDVEIVGAIFSARRLQEAVDRLQPDTIVVEGDPSRKRKVDWCFPGVRVITLTLDANTLEVCDRRHVQVTGTRDLLWAVTGGDYAERVHGHTALPATSAGI